MSEPDRQEIEALKQYLTAAVESCGVAVQRVGKNLLARCAFHDDKDASLVINEKLWHCFGCHSGGDAFDFLQLKEKLTFAEALDRLRSIAGVTPAPNGARNGNGNGQIHEHPAEPLLPDATRAELLEQVTSYYASRLRENREAREYLTRRGLGSPELLDAFRLGYADGSLLATLPAQGEVRQGLTRLGVITPQGREHFYGCIVVPLTHPDLPGHGVLGLYGRKTAPHARVPHLYLTGPKRGVLNWPAVKLSPHIFLTESVLDALSLWIAGVRDVTCLYGAGKMHEDLETLLTRFGTKEVRLCLDADRAGQAAIEPFAARLSARGIRCLQVVLPAKDPNQVLVEKGAEALCGAVRQLNPVSTAPPAASTPDAAPFEATEDGFVLRLGPVVYRVTPHPKPSGGRLLVSVRAAGGGKTFVDKVDLMSSRARVLFVGQAHRTLSVDKDELEQHVSRLLEATEQWVQEAAARTSQELETAARPPDLSTAEQEEAQAFLSGPDLVGAILADMEALGFMGEESGKLLAYLIGLSRLLEHPLSGVVISQSGAGKSSLTELVELMTPPESVVLFARLSTLALYFLPRDYLKRKLLILEERDGAEAASYSIRVLQSKNRLTQAVVEKDAVTGKMQTRVFEVEGPIAYLETTTNPRLNHENATRCFEILLDESEAQTDRIHRHQRAACKLEGLARQNGRGDIQRRHHNAQRMLERVKVVIPYVDLLTFPKRWLRTRRDHERFLCLIRASAFLHQKQRERKLLQTEGQEILYVEATPSDYRLAYRLARDVLSATLHELSRTARDLLEAAGGMVVGNVETTFTRRELREHTGWQDFRLRDALNELVEMEYLGAVGSQGKTFQYHLKGGAAAPTAIADLTTPEELEQRWGSV